MKELQIFFASSINELKEDRLEIGNFVRTLNDFYCPKGIYIRLVMCEDLDNAIEMQRKQNMYNEKIKESDIFVIVLYQNAGKYTLEEFDVAYKSFLQNQNPQIYTFFKDCSQGPNQSVIEFMQILDNELHHYFNRYSHIDSLKLSLIINLTQQKMEGISQPKISVNNGEVSINETKIMGTDQLPYYSNNKDLQEFKREYDELIEKLVDYKKKLADASDDNIFVEMGMLVGQKNTLANKIKELEGNIINLIISIHSNNDKEEKTKRQLKADECLMRGDYEGAGMWLNYEEVVKDIRLSEQIENIAKGDIQNHVNELIQIVTMVKVQFHNKDRYAEINRCYLEAIRLEKEYQLPKVAMFSRFMFLFSQGDYETTIQLGKELEYYYSNPDKPGDINDFVNLYSILLELYIIQTKDEIVTLYAKKLLDIIEQDIRMEEDTESLNTKSIAYNNLGRYHMYISPGRNPLVEEYWGKAFEIRRKLYQDNPSYAMLNHVSSSYNNLGVYYFSISEYEKAEEYYLCAIRGRKKLTDNDYDAHVVDLAESYDNLGMLYIKTMKNDKAYSIYQEAFEPWKYIFQCSVKVRVKDFIFILNFLCEYTKEHELLEDEKKYLLTKINLMEQLKTLNYVEQNSVNDSLVEDYDRLAYVGNAMADYKCVVFAYDNEVRIINDTKPEATTNLVVKLGYIYHNKLMAYRNLEDLENAIHYGRLALEMLEQLRSYNLSKINIAILMDYNDIGGMYVTGNNFIEAEKYFNKGSELDEKITQDITSDTPADYIDTLKQLRKNRYQNMSILYEAIGDDEKKRFFEREVGNVD